MPINDIEAFARRMQALGADFGYPPLVVWGRQLAEQAELFNLDGINALLDGFKNRIEELEELLTEEAPPGSH
jgi:extradiol dioxygenase family protein